MPVTQKPYEVYTMASNKTFLMYFQMQRVTKDKCIDIINRYEPSKDGRKKGQLGIDGE